MWELLILLFLGFVSIYLFDPLFQYGMKHTSYTHKLYRDKREKMNFPSSHISTSLITPDNSPCSSRTATRPSTPIISSYRNSPLCLDSPIIPLSRSSSRRSLFSNELYDSSSDYCYHD